MTEQLIMELFGGRVFGRVLRKTFSEKTVVYNIIAPHGHTYDVSERIIGKRLTDQGLMPTSRENGEIELGDYVEVELPGWFKDPKLHTISAYAESRPENYFSEIGPTTYTVESITEI